MNFGRIFSLITLVMVVGLGYFTLNNQQQIQDWWFLRSYQAPAEISALADSAGLSDQGRDYFYVSSPEINDKQTFNDNCPFKERTIVLGCYDGQKIYILDINEPTLEGVETVTAAHEMLHAAYSRLSDDERTRVDELVNRQFKQTKNQRILDLIAEYDTSDQALINNELHSILPTELEELIPELQAYYDDLFDDRLKVVTAAQRYEKVFVELEDQLAQLQAEVDGYKSQIASYESQLADYQAQITEGRSKLDRLNESGAIEEYNNLVPVFNELVRRYNRLITDLEVVVAEHNRTVQKINDTALEHNELVNTIDSKYQEL